MRATFRNCLPSLPKPLTQLALADVHLLTAVERGWKMMSHKGGLDLDIYLSDRLCTHVAVWLMTMNSRIFVQ